MLPDSVKRSNKDVGLGLRRVGSCYYPLPTRSANIAVSCNYLGLDSNPFTHRHTEYILAYKVIQPLLLKASLTCTHGLVS